MKEKRKIYVYDRDRKCLGSFDTIFDAAVATGAKTRGIWNCLHGKQNYSSGLDFSYQDPDVLIESSFSYPYYTLLDGSKIHIDDTWRDIYGYLRRKKSPDDTNIIPTV